MRRVTITLPADVAKILELRAAIDDLRMEEGIEQLLTHLAQPLVEQRAKIEAERAHTCNMATAYH